jgi:hypothetical protein
MRRLEGVNAAEQLNFGLALAAKEGKRNQSLISAETTRQCRPRLFGYKLLDGCARVVQEVWKIDGDDLVAEESSVDTTEQLTSLMTR